MFSAALTGAANKRVIALTPRIERLPIFLIAIFLSLNDNYFMGPSMPLASINSRPMTLLVKL